MTADDDRLRSAWFRRDILPLEGQLRSYVQRISSGRFDTEDIVQEALARAVMMDNWRGITEPAAFLRIVARNLVTDQFRRERVVAIDSASDFELAQFADDAPDPETTMSGRDELRRLAAIVSAMPPQCRRVFTLRKIYDLSMREIGDRLGLSVSTVEKHLAKGLRLCVEQLGRSQPSGDSDDHGSESDAAPGKHRRGRRPVGRPPLRSRLRRD